MRERDKWISPIRDVPVYSDANGELNILDLTTKGGLQIIDSNLKVVGVEILDTGRPVILDDRFGYTVHSATTSHPVLIRVRDKRNQPIVYVTFEGKGTKPVQITVQVDPDLGDIVQVRDRNNSDKIVMKSFPETSVQYGSVAIVDTQNHQTLGVVDPRGDMYLVPDSGITLQIKRARTAEDPVIFEIFKNKSVVGELYIPISGRMIRPIIPEGEEDVMENEDEEIFAEEVELVE